jgi:hypothetical protein
LLVELEECSCSLESPLGELSLDDDEWCSLVVVGSSATAGAATTTAGAATTIGGGDATTTGAPYAVGGAGATLLVSLDELELSVVSANPTATVPNRAAALRAIVAVFNKVFIMLSPKIFS